MSIIAGGCRKHGSDCKCTPGIVTSNLELYAECQGEQHDMIMDRFGPVCCDQGHEFAVEVGDILGVERRIEDRFPAEQAGHVWTESPRCRRCCPSNHDYIGGQQA